jgi:hypothetical protein
LTNFSHFLGNRKSQDEFNDHITISKMQNIILAISILLAINALLLIFSVNRNETKTSKELQKPPPPITKLVKEDQTGHRATEPNGTAVFRNLKQIGQDIS